MTGTTLVERGLLRLSGGEVRLFLQGLVTQDMDQLASANPLYAGLLSAQGKLLFDFILWTDGADILIDAEAAQIDALARRLALYRLRREVKIETEHKLAVHWSSGGAEGVPDPRLAALGRRWLAPADDGGTDDEWRAHRLALGVTEGVAEHGDGTTLWLETNAKELNGVSFTKGCYVGQENTARMNYRNKVNRRLVAVPIGAAGPAPRATYEDVGLAVEHRRVDALGDAIIPDWLVPALG